MSQVPVSQAQAQPKINNLYATQALAKTNEAGNNFPNKKSDLEANNNLQRVRSQQRCLRNTALSAEKRVKLRDYLFVAKSSLQKNKEMMKELKKSVPDKGTIAESLQKIKKKKYSLTNKEIHTIVKKQLQKDMQNTIKSMQVDLQFIRNLDLEDVSNEDLVFLHELRGILSNKISPAMNEIRQFSLKRQSPLIRHIIALGSASQKPNQIRIQDKQDSAQKTKGKADKQKQLLSPKMSKPPTFTPNTFFDSLMNSTNAFI